MGLGVGGGFDAQVVVVIVTEEEAVRGETWWWSRWRPAGPLQGVFVEQVLAHPRLCLGGAETPQAPHVVAQLLNDHMSNK